MWKTVKLGDVCTIKTGKKDVNEGNSDGAYPFFTCAKEHTYSDVYSFDCEAILIAGNGAVGQTTYFKGKFEAYQRTYVLSDFQAVLPKLLLFMLQGRLMQHLSSMVLGNTIPYIKKGMLSDFEFSLPPLAEQQRIVAKLDAAFAEIDRAIGVAKAKEAEVDKFKASLLHALLWCDAEMWRTVKLGQVIEKTRTVNPSTEFPNDYFEYVDVSSVNNATLKIEETHKLLGEDAPSRARREIQENDVIFATIRPTLRRIALVPSSLNGQICSTGYTVLRANRKQILQTYLFYVMIGSKAMSYMKDSQTGTSYPAVTDKQVKDFEFSLPPLAEQQRIVSKLDTAFAEIDTANAAIASQRSNYSALKSAILAQELQPSEAA